MPELRQRPRLTAGGGDVRSPNRSDARRAADAGHTAAYTATYRPYGTAADWHQDPDRHRYRYGAVRAGWATRALAAAFAEHGPSPKELDTDDDPPEYEPPEDDPFEWPDEDGPEPEDD